MATSRVSLFSDNNQVKVCKECGQEKPFSEFHKQKGGLYGLRAVCKDCRNAYHKQHRSKPEIQERQKAYSREYNSRPEIQAKMREYRKRPDVKERTKKSKQKYRSKPETQAKEKAYAKEYCSRPEVKARRKAYNKEYLSNPDVQQHYRQWYRNRRCNDEYRKQRNERLKEQRKNDPVFRLNHMMSNRIHRYLKTGKGGKSWRDLVPYTLDELKTHLENQFQPGMTWENYGYDGWVIDHIQPLSVHCFESPEHEDFRRAWALTNLRPLWREDNAKKYANLTKPFQPSLPM